MKEFTDSRGTEQVKIAPGHPAANNVETVMKPLGKAMRIGVAEKTSEKESLQSFLRSYRDIPHPSTGVAPASMLFRDGVRSNLPRQTLSNDEVLTARKTDKDSKETRKADYNASRHVKPANFQAGEQVLVRNYTKKSKYEPTFLPERYVVVDVMANGKIVLVQSSRTGRFLKRHPNDIKLFEGDIPEPSFNKSRSEEEILQAWREAFAALDFDTAGDDGSEDAINPGLPEPERHMNRGGEAVLPQAVRRSGRERNANPRYFNDNFQT